MTDSTAVRLRKIRLASGVRLQVAESGNPKGVPILFLHGWPDSWFSFSRVMPLLPGTIRALAVDQRGFGNSDKPATGYSIPELGADVVALLDALGIDRAALVGHSYGSFVARRVAIAFPQRVSKLVLIGTGFLTSNGVTRDLQKTLRQVPDPIPVAFAREFQASTLHRTVPVDFFERGVAEALKLPFALWGTCIDGVLEYHDAEHLEQVKAPTLLLWGDRDTVFSRIDQDSCRLAIANSRLTIYEETGHCPNWEVPERVAADIAAFVATR